MVDQADVDDNTTTVSNNGREVNTAADLAKLRNDGKLLTPQELKELNTRVKALEEMARLEDRLRALENRKRSRSERTESALPLENPTAGLQPQRGSRNSSSRQNRPTAIHPSIEQDDSDSDSDSSSGSSKSVTYHRHKRQRITRGIKVVPSYTLKVSSSLREWGDWKKDIERVFEGDPYTYQTGFQKILKALDYLDSSLKSLWYTYNDQQGIGKWSTFVNWTRENIQNGQNATATLYEQLNSARQLLEQSPVEFNAYLSAIERDLPQQDDKASAMTFYSKLTKELKKQFKTSDIPIPETRAKCVAVAQRVWEGLHGFGERKNSKEKDSPSHTPSPKYPRADSKRDRKDRYHLSHRHRNDRHKEKTRTTPEKELLVCYKCNKPGHYANNCSNEKEYTKKAKIQSTRKDHSQSRASSQSSSQSSSRSSSEAPKSPVSNSDSGDSLN
jgi:hypothetical protein